ncbi:MAG TPA: UDP-2,3-diacylglucosamine diphosphatase LpxI [Xanthobacteraceae bacterium]|nr:UDP-2,3-diacylglucosamine diphosphatase LpxI [Xanthobacteraceae bacterium]
MTTPRSTQAGPLAIICGGGSIPQAVAGAVSRSGRRVVLFPLRGWADAEFAAHYPHHWIAVAQVGRFFRLARAEGCRDVVLIGSLVRPPARALRLDWGALRLLPRILRAYRGGDDHLLSRVGKILEEHGFRLLGAHEVAPEILVPEGALARREPGPRDRADIARALALLATMGPFDVGQSVVLADGHVLAVEAAEGTDQMLARVADLRAQGRIPTPPGSGVLVKAPKPGQDRRLDLPAIGPETVERAARAGLAGVAVAADATIAAEPAEIVRAADRAGVFVVGVRQGGDAA